MFDNQKRKIDYLRVSVTDKCNLRCVYCMPPEGVSPMCHEDVLSYEEIVRICRIAGELGIRKYKIPGGEPLARRGCDRLIAMLKALPQTQSVTVTTNGQLLAGQLPKLVAAGTDGINISLDTLDPGLYARITRGGSLEQVMEGLKAAVDSGIRTKINCVSLRGLNDTELIKMAGLARQFPVDVRFIELMPLGNGTDYVGMRGEEVLEALRAAYGEEQPVEGARGNGPAVYCRFPDFRGSIGFIDAISHRFCDRCNRVRLTCDGMLKPCLSYEGGYDLRALLRNCADDEKIRSIMEDAIAQKPKAHCFQDEDGKETRSMAQIGG